MATRIRRQARCAIGRHTPRHAHAAGEAISRDTCRYCGVAVMRTMATRVWFLADVLATADPGPDRSRAAPHA